MQLALLYKICYTPLLPFHFMNLRADLFVQQCQISLSLREGSWIALLLYCSFRSPSLRKFLLSLLAVERERTKFFLLLFLQSRESSLRLKVIN